MQPFRLMAICWTLAACGRLGFDVLGTDDAKGPDANAPDESGDCDRSVRGSVCAGGAISAGSWGGRDYMITPSGCSDGTTPICDGSTDTLTKTWFGTGGAFVNIPGVENRLAGAPASVLGDANTEAAATHVSVTADSAIRYCYDLDFGGFTDWYLPATSEFIWVVLCHSNATIDAIYPLEDVGCAVAGRTMELTGFAVAQYWTSTESDSGGTAAARMHFDNGGTGDNFKNELELVRCVRYDP